jgi:galactokinase
VKGPREANGPRGPRGARGPREPSEDEAAARTDEALKALAAQAPAGRAFVPGRLEVLGKHTDYAGGESLTCALERGFTVAFVPRLDSTIRIVDAHDRRRAEFALSPDLDPPIGDWANYPMTVARRLARNFPGIATGADIAFYSTVPRAAGLSTSSAMMIAAYLVLASVNDLSARPEHRATLATPEALAGYLGSVENGQAFGPLAGDHGVGTFGGSQDHTAILLSEADRLGRYRYQPVTRLRQIALAANLTFVVAGSGVIAAKTGSVRQRYNQAAALVTTLLAEWRLATGRSDVTLADALKSSPDAVNRMRTIARAGSRPYGPRQLEDRLEHFLLEDRLVLPSAIDALDTGRLELFGQLVDRSQRGAEELLGNQVDETIALARLAREHGAIAASAFGAGFGGSVWALVEAARAGAFSERWREAYLSDQPGAAARGATFFTTRPGAGARVD